MYPEVGVALGRVPFEEGQEGEGKAEIAGGGRKEGVRVGIFFGNLRCWLELQRGVVGLGVVLPQTVS